MQTFNGIIRQQKVNPGSKSEGTAVWLICPDGEAVRALRLYRSGMPDISDPFFTGLDGRHVTVSGQEEDPDYLCVEEMTVTDEPAPSESVSQEPLNNQQDE